MFRGDVFAHHQEHFTVFTVSGSIHPSLLLAYQTPATWVNTTGYCKYSQVLLMMGENIAPKHVELTWRNKLTCTFASCW